MTTASIVANTGKLAGKTILITGASRGFGASLAQKVAADGANVVVLSKTVSKLDKLPGTIYETQEAVIKAGGKCLPIQLDVRDENAVKLAIDQAVSKFGAIDILVNNASAMYPYRLEKLETKRFHLMNDVILRGTFLMSKYCLPHMKQSSNSDSKHILNISPPITIESDWFKELGHLAVMKYAVSLSTLAMSRDLTEYGIAVNSLWPKSAFWSGFMSRAGGYTDALKKYCRKPSVMSDAAYLMLCENSTQFNGNFVFDDDFLQLKGVNDFTPYAEEPGNPIFIDIFVKPEQCTTFEPIVGASELSANL